MSVEFLRHETHDANGHHYRAYEFKPGSSWGESLAQEYRRLRTETVVPLQAVVLEGVEILDMANLRRRLENASTPEYSSGVFNVVRSDFGELL